MNYIKSLLGIITMSLLLGLVQEAKAVPGYVIPWLGTYHKRDFYSFECYDGTFYQDIEKYFACAYGGDPTTYNTTTTWWIENGSPTVTTSQSSFTTYLQKYCWTCYQLQTFYVYEDSASFSVGLKNTYTTAKTVRVTFTGTPITGVYQYGTYGVVEIQDVVVPASGETSVTPTASFKDGSVSIQVL